MNRYPRYELDYLHLLCGLVNRLSHARMTRNGAVVSQFGQQIRVPFMTMRDTKLRMGGLDGPLDERDWLVEEGPPKVMLLALQSKRVFVRGAVEEILWMMRGETDNGTLKDARVHIWDDWESDDELLNRVYGAQWRMYECEGERPVLLTRRSAPEPGEALRPEHVRPIARSEVAFDEADPFCGQLIEGASGPYVVVKRVGGGRNSRYEVVFLDTSHRAVVSRPNITTARDPWALSVCGVACLGEVREKRRSYHKRAYDMWHAMVSRCHNPDHPSFGHYGAKGCYVSPRWLVFATFLRDLSRVPFFYSWLGYGGGWQLDKDYWGSGCYDLSTCIFLRRSENLSYANAVHVRSVDADGVERLWVTVKDAAEAFDLHERRLSEHLRGERVLDTGGVVFERYEPPQGSVLRYERVIDQLANVLVELRRIALDEVPHNRRLVVSAWNPSKLQDMALPPCHYSFSLHTSEGRGRRRQLHIVVNQRSADIFLGVPFNMIGYSTLLAVLCSLSGLEPGSYTHNFGDLHLYANHEAAACQQINGYNDLHVDSGVDPTAFVRCDLEPIEPTPEAAAAALDGLDITQLSYQYSSAAPAIHAPVSP